MRAQPKGGMCATCVRKHEDCSGLPFKDMPVLFRTPWGNTVKCIEYQRSPTNPHTPPSTPTQDQKPSS